MSSEWAKFTDLLAAIVDNRGKTCPVGEIGLPLIATNCINGKDLYPSYETTRFVSDETYSTWFRGHPQPGDILFVCKGSPGRTNWVPDPVGFCIAQDMVAVRADPTKVYPKYFFAVLRSDIVQSQIENMHVGTVIPHFKKGDFDKLKIPLLDNSSQVAVGDLYFELSERITLLRETNATLEGVAQALFKSWFVDFDPVRAKMEGRAPEGMDEATAALFPDGLDASELGLVPRGWKASTLAGLTAQSVGSIQTGPFGSQLHASDYVQDGVPVVMPKDISSRRVQTDTIARVPVADADRLARHKLIPGDIVFSRRGDVERHALISETERGWLCGTGCLLLRPGKHWPSPNFLSLLLDAPQSRTWLVQHAVGATMPNLNTGILGSVPVVVPPSSLLTAFEDFVSGLEARRAQNAEMARTLATLRDAMLPRLISGQLRLPEIETSSEKTAA